jgi:hypothetical protein
MYRLWRGRRSGSAYARAIGELIVPRNGQRRQSRPPLSTSMVVHRFGALAAMAWASFLAVSASDRVAAVA